MALGPHVTLRRTTQPRFIPLHPNLVHFSELLSKLEHVPARVDEIRRNRHSFLIYHAPSHSDLQALFGALYAKLSGKHQRDLCLSLIEKTEDRDVLAAYIHKTDKAVLVNAGIGLNLSDDVWVNRAMKLSTTPADCKADVVATMTALCKCSKSSMTTMLYDEHDKHVTLEYVDEATRELSDDQLRSLKFIIQQASSKNMTGFSLAFHRGKVQLKERRAARQSVEDNIHLITKKNAALHLQAMSEFRPEWSALPMEVFDRSLVGGHQGPLTIGDFFADKRLYSQTSLLIGGTSRYGKTELLKAQFFLLSLRLRGKDPVLGFVQTVDKLKVVQDHLSRGSCLLLDDIDPSDREQLIHSSHGIWKSLLAVASPADVRGRNSDASIASGVPRGITTNLESADEWISSITVKEVDQLAIRSRLCFVNVRERLWVRDEPPANSARILQPVMTSTDAEAAMEAMLMR
ncbi:unnamed protein product [Polarella glacialis]|uniref:Uncharacterized protein n=2 Tax=Polarella glacialis TaxID=89957 RepID=A0A813G098_POLGL|nr:unnamed protein product [Polarella glacialis]